MSQTKLAPEIRRLVLDLAQHRTKPYLYQCADCRKYFSLNAVNIDHIIRESESTPEQRTDPGNLQVLCNPKRSTRINSCHKKKNAREAAAEARRNRIPYRWTPSLMYGSASIILGGYTWESVFQHDEARAQEWLLWSGVTIGATFSTYLVQKGWRRRRPRRSISPEPVPQDEPGQEQLDTTRIVMAAREIIGAKGTVAVKDVDGLDAFTLIYADTGFADHEDEKRFDLLNKIQAKIGGRWRPVWDTMRDRVRFTRRPELARMIRHPGLPPERAWNILPVAPGVSFDLKVTPHILIVGTTGAGKTALMRTIIVAVADSAAREKNTELILADPKRIEMPGFRGFAGVRSIVSESEDLWDMAFDLEREMNDRTRLVLAGKAKPGDFKRIIVVIDEYEQFFKRMFRHWTTALDEDGKPLKKAGQKVPGAIDCIQSVLSMARRVNIHLIIGTQSPDSAWFGGTGTRENLSGRAAVGPVDQYRAKMMFDDSSVGRDIPIEFKGRTTIQVGNGLPEEIQVYFTPDPFDPDEDNTAEDWATLLRLGMPASMLPDDFKEMVPSA
jgi:energy-coupling factor transporter ATP-binding protein EcfA2